MTELVLRTLAFTLLVGLAFMPLEWAFPLRREPRASRASDLGFATLGHVIARLGAVFLVGVVLTMLVPFGIARPFYADIANPGLRRAVSITTGLLLFELGGYAYHRLAHAMPLLFRFHEVHHSSESLDWLASFRQHPVEIWLMMLAQNVPLVLVGMRLGDHAWVIVWLRIHTVFVHADLRTPGGFWTELIATPRFHHRHHDRDLAPANFATLFPFFDRMFGTYDGASATRFGLPYAMPSGLFGLLAHPVTSLIRRRAPTPPLATAPPPSRPMRR